MRRTLLIAAGLVSGMSVGIESASAGMPATTCEGPIGSGFGQITIDPDQRDGTIRGSATYSRMGALPAPIEFQAKKGPMAPCCIDRAEQFSIQT